MVCRINESAEDDCVEKREYETIVTKHMFRLENRKLYICNNHWMTEFKTISDKEVYGQAKWKNVYFSLFVLSLKLSFETLKIRTSSKYWLPIKSENKCFNVLVNELLKYGWNNYDLHWTIKETTLLVPDPSLLLAWQE